MTYYKDLVFVPSKRQEKATKRKAYIYQVWKESKQRYGAPKIQKILQFQGIYISLKSVQRYRKELGTRSLIVKNFELSLQFEKITDTKKENLLKQDFTETTIHQKWCIDITYIHTKKEGWTYLDSVMDLHSRKILGYAYEKTMKVELAIKVVQDAYLHVKNPKGIVLHRDLGVKYTSHMFEGYLKQKGIIHSFSRKGNPYDNACIESFHSILKKEEVNPRGYENFEIARRTLFEYIESWYNRKRYS